MSDQDNQDVFQDKKPAETQPPSSPLPNRDYAHLLASIKNERGEQKYDSLEKALEALQHSQTYIPQLKTDAQKYQEELERVKAELDKRASVEDVVSRLTGNQPKNPQDTASTPAAERGLDEQTVTQLFEQLMARKQSETTAESNRKRVNEALSSAYGEKTPDVVAEKAKELGISPKELGKMASQSPDVVLELFKMRAPKASNPTTGSINIPPYKQTQDAVQPPKKSVLSGASSKDQIEHLRQHRANVYRKFDVQE